MPLSPRVPELTALDLLLSVAHLGSLGRAAQEHGISQPAASSRIRRVERLLGIELLHRGPRGSRLTTQGELVAGWAREVIDAAAALDAGVRALREDRASRIKIAASFTIAEYLIPGWLATLHSRSPDLAVSVRVGNSVDVAGLVLGGEVDAGFVEGFGVARGLRSRQFSSDHLVLVVARDHPWARRTVPVTPATLAATPLVRREPGSGTREVFDRIMVAHGPSAPPVAELSSTTAIKAAVVAGAGPAVLSWLTVADDISTGRLVEVPISDIDLSRRLRVVWASGRTLSGPVKDLVTIALGSRGYR
jgi:DNA-binding transcriptional LysR family regulator